MPPFMASPWPSPRQPPGFFKTNSRPCRPNGDTAKNSQKHLFARWGKKAAQKASCTGCFFAAACFFKTYVRPCRTNDNEAKGFAKTTFSQMAIKASQKASCTGSFFADAGFCKTDVWPCRVH